MKNRIPKVKVSAQANPASSAEVPSNATASTAPSVICATLTPRRCALVASAASATACCSEATADGSGVLCDSRVQPLPPAAGISARSAAPSPTAARACSGEAYRFTDRAPSVAPAAAVTTASPEEDATATDDVEVAAERKCTATTAPMASTIMIADEMRNSLPRTRTVISRPATSIQSARPASCSGAITPPPPGRSRTTARPPRRSATPGPGRELFGAKHSRPRPGQD